MACRIDADVDALPDPLPSDLTDVEERHAGAAAQLAKEILMVLAGIETKTGGSMAAAERSVFFKDAYDRWVGAVEKHNDKTPILYYLDWTTATCSSRVTGKNMYRKFSEGLKVFHNQFNPLWKKVLGGNVSGRSAEELWEDFLVYLYLQRKGVKAGNMEEMFEAADREEIQPEIMERKCMWVHAYKHLGPPAEKLRPPFSVHEILAEPSNLQRRGTDWKKRKAEGLSRKTSKEKMARMHKTATLRARATAAVSNDVIDLKDKVVLAAAITHQTAADTPTSLLTKTERIA